MGKILISRDKKGMPSHRKDMKLGTMVRPLDTTAHTGHTYLLVEHLLQMGPFTGNGYGEPFIDEEQLLR